MPPGKSSLATMCVFLIALAGVVHAAGGAAGRAFAADPVVTAPPITEAGKQPADLPDNRCGDGPIPAAVREMRDAILAAAESGRIDELKEVFELNELPPNLGADPKEDPIAYLKAQSGDADGKALLSALARIIAAGCARVPAGRDIENNRVFVWPYLADMALDGLTEEHSAALDAIAGKDAADAMCRSGKYAFWRIEIGADGTWHSLVR